MLFDRLEIDTNDVLMAASTKWNFLNFKPGLVGGHCIGVDPYYLAFKANEIGYHAEMIESGRRINDQVPKFIIEKLTKEIIKQRINPLVSKFLILGYTFKENCPDVRNTKVSEIIQQLNYMEIDFDIVDPYVGETDQMVVDNIIIKNEIPEQKYDVIIAAVGHSEFREKADIILERHAAEKCILFDIKNIFY